MVRCALCGDYYVDELIHGSVAINRHPFYIGHDGFVCPDCIDDFLRMSPVGQYKLLREGEKMRMIEQLSIFDLLDRRENKNMEKQVVKLESLLTVISPGQVVRIMDETMTPTANFVDPGEITAFKGTAVEAFREYAGKGATIKHISPEVEKEPDSRHPGRYVMHIYIYQDPARYQRER